MTQTEMTFCAAPHRGTMVYELLCALQAGEKLTPLLALEKYHCLSLSQRIGELKKQGWPILTEMVEVASGKRVACYSMSNPRRFT